MEDDIQIVVVNYRIERARVYPLLSMMESAGAILSRKQMAILGFGWMGGGCVCVALVKKASAKSPKPLQSVPTRLMALFSLLSPALHHPCPPLSSSSSNKRFLLSRLKLWVSSSSPSSSPESGTRRKISSHHWYSLPRSSHVEFAITLLSIFLPKLMGSLFLGTNSFILPVICKANNFRGTTSHDFWPFVVVSICRQTIS